MIHLNSSVLLKGLGWIGGFKALCCCYWHCLQELVTVSRQQMTLALQAIGPMLGSPLSWEASSALELEPGLDLPWAGSKRQRAAFGQARLGR